MATMQPVLRSHLWSISACSILLLSLLAPPASAEGHFLPGVVPIRDFAAIAPGFYYEQYNVFYTSDRFKDRDGRTVKSVSVGGVRADIDLEVDMFAIVPTLSYMSDLGVLGSKLGFSIAPSFGSTSVSAAVSTGQAGFEIDDSSFGVGDLYVQPLWMVWERPLMDLTLAYAFYAPVGEFDADDVDNIGLGYWSNQFQATGLFFLDESKATALALVGTFEINGEQDDSTYQPGNNLALEWGLSQFLTDHVEVGVSGYHYWQVSDDKGLSGPLTPDRERVHGIGGQVGLYPSERWGLIVRALGEIEARSRFEGTVLSLTAFVAI